MSGHVFMNLKNELGGERDKMHNKFDKFNNTKTRMLDSVYHMT